MATLKIKNGLIAVKPGILATSCAPSGPNCNQLAGITGPQTCWCAGSNRYAVCLSGFTGVNIGLNNNGMPWLLDRTGGSGVDGTYVATSGSLEVRLLLYNSPAGPDGEWWTPGDWSGRSYTLSAYRNGAVVYTVKGSDVDWVGDCETPGLSLAGCSANYSVRGISFRIVPMADWFPRQVRLTISGATRCCATCCTSGNYIVNSANLNGVYVLDLDVAGLGSVPNEANYWLRNVSSYSYTLYGGSNCSGGNYTQTGQYDLFAQIDSGSFTVWAAQTNHPNPVTGYDLYAWAYWDYRCNEVAGSASDIHVCPRNWGNWGQIWVKTAQGGQASLVAI